MYDTMMSILQRDEFTVVESLEIPGGPARFKETPQYLYATRVGTYLDSVRGTSSLWSHQAEALEVLGNGDNVVLSTGTASGKSLVFRSHSFHDVLLDPSNRVLVFYPLLALLADQLRGWREMCRGLGLDGDFIGQIDGTVPTQERDEILQRSRIVLMTPDVCQAWLMSRLAMPVVKQLGIIYLCTWLSYVPLPLR